jgi:hypothetical protein
VKRGKTISGRKGERGVVILLVAVFLLFVVGAMAALAIDVVTFYTARSEAQLAADGAALAAARVIANSGMTSNPANVALVTNVELLARTVATQVATHNKVGGRFLNGSEITINIQPSLSLPVGKGSANPQITVRISRTDLPAFFARIWGRTQVAVSASAKAEAYNPSGLNVASGQAPPVAPVCVKPWVLPNLDPMPGGSTIFDLATGEIQDPALLGADLTTVPFVARCDNDCTPAANPPSKWQFYAGDQSSFPAPTRSLPTCNVALNDYQTSIAGCVQTPISCNGTVNLDLNPDSNRNRDTAHAVNCLTHTLADKGDSIDPASGNPPFQFIGGLDNPVAGAQGANILVSDSLVTVPVYDSSAPFLSTSVQVIGFVQLFLNPNGTKASPGGGPIDTRVVNLVGCGTNATGQAVLGNGPSAIPVRLISQ